jgi:hypothetical protein
LCPLYRDINRVEAAQTTVDALSLHYESPVKGVHKRQGGLSK